MKPKDQKRIIRELCDSLKKELIAASVNIPENWDGIEIREWFADKADRNRAHLLKQQRSRLRSYRSDVATRYGL